MRFFTSNFGICRLEISATVGKAKNQLIKKLSFGQQKHLNDTTVAQYDIDADVQIQSIYCQVLERRINVFKFAKIDGDIFSTSEERFIEKASLKNEEIRFRSRLTDIFGQFWQGTEY